MIEVFDSGRHFPHTLQGRLLVRYRSYDRATRRIPFLQGVYTYLGGGLGRMEVKALAGSPDCRVLPSDMIALVCDSMQEYNQIADWVKRGANGRDSELEARREILRLAGINEEPDDIEGPEPPRRRRRH